MEMNRRNLLKGSVAMGAAGLVASKAAVAAVPAKWDETVDIVVIGSGFAGLVKDKIEAELTYPGQIKVTVIRETRSCELAK